MDGAGARAITPDPVISLKPENYQKPNFLNELGDCLGGIFDPLNSKGFPWFGHFLYRMIGNAGQGNP
ncbi:hypothetical protein [Roseovarius sp. MMSF_3305]|uniref:hypothetical protein n=1 Tax=Roseovarius sp. MMSF_3305 TaxID=3046697 RepID=UPI00273D12ED|nr:hypothetical protein [Roseovarius sp. MMSF_3305]